MTFHLLPRLSVLPRLLAGLAGGLLLASAPVASAAVDVYVKFANGSGSYAGESTASGRTGWAEVLAVALEASSTPPSGTTGATKPVFAPLVLTRKVDRLSPILFFDLASSTSIPADGSGVTNVVIEYVKSSGSATGVTFLKIELKNVYVTSLDNGYDSNSEFPFETVKLTYAAIRFTYQATDASGSPTGSPIINSWSTVTNSPTY